MLRSSISHVMLVAVFALYGVLPWLASLAGHQGFHAYVPPFVWHIDASQHQHLGAEYRNVAISLYEGRGFSSPFSIPSGPTAWVPPLLPWFLSVCLTITHGSLVETSLIYLVLNTLVIAWVAVSVATICHRLWNLPRWVTMTGIGLVLVSHFQDCFQRTHDSTFLLLIVHLLTIQTTAIEKLLQAHESISKTALAKWTAIGGISTYLSPIVVFVWSLLTIRWITKCLFSNYHIDRRPLHNPIQKAVWPRLVACLAIAFFIQLPWLVRNYCVLERFIPIKSNGLFELEQSLLEDDDGIIDFRNTKKHPYVDEDEAWHHAQVGEISYIEERRITLMNSFWEHKWKYLSDCSNRLMAMSFVLMPYFPDHNLLPWTRFCRLLYALPLAVYLTSLLWSERLQVEERIGIWIFLAYLFPYLVISYYSRYMTPMIGLRCLFLLAGIGRLRSLGTFNPSPLLGDKVVQ